jgi:cytochrome oxidase Cu insertion factor (SCO1/SenC/PrrC family)
MTDGDAAARRKNRLQMLAIMAIALVSLGGSYLLFYAARGGDTWGTTNNGVFVTPALTVGDLGIRDSEGQPLQDGGTWWLWVVPEGSCDDACDTALHQLRQLHALLNKDAPRVRRALVQPSGVAVAEALAARYPKLARLSGEVDELAPGVYIVDPIGNLVLHYPLADAGKPVLEDLKKLLKVSQIG